MLLLFTPGAPREDYFETLADAARREAMGEDDWAAFFLRHDTFWVSQLVERHRLRAVRLAGAGLRVDGGAGRLAGGAPPGDPLLRGRALLAEQDRRAAPEAGLAAAAEHPVVAAPPPIAGGVLLGVVQVGPHQRAGPSRGLPGRARRPPGPTGGRRG